MSKGTKKSNNQGNIFSIPESIIPEDKRIFYPSWTNRPPEAKALIKMQNRQVLTQGNSMSVVSKPGTGKSGICESICANHINPHCDALGFTVEMPPGRRKILYIDCERTRIDTWNSWHRMLKRAGITKPKAVGNMIIENDIVYANFKAVPLNERRKYVEEIFNKNPDIGLTMFDGAGDFIADTNSIPESTGFTDWINTFNPRISTLFTLHTNPGSDKPRGHIGSELCRRSESIFLLRKLDDGTREITTNYEFGKVRNDSDNISSYYRYEEHPGMFMSCEYDKQDIRSNEKQVDKKNSDILLARKIFEFAGKQELSYSYMADQIVNIRKCELNTAKQFVTRNLIPVLSKTDSGGYRLLDDGLVIPLSQRTN